MSPPDPADPPDRPTAFAQCHGGRPVAKTPPRPDPPGGGDGRGRDRDVGQYDAGDADGADATETGEDAPGRTRLGVPLPSAGVDQTSVALLPWAGRA